MSVSKTVFWVRTENVASFVYSFAQIRSQLTTGHPSEADNTLNLREILEQTCALLGRKGSNVLLVLDNADNIDIFCTPSSDGIRLRDYMPTHCHILVTIRDDRWLGKLVPADDGIYIVSMSPMQAVSLLLGSKPQYLRIVNPTELQASATALVEQLGNLPLAVSQAAANIRENSLSLNAYITLYQDKTMRMKLLREGVFDDTRRRSQSVLVTREISLDYIFERNPISFDLPCLMGFLSWQNIPRHPLRLLIESRHSISDVEFQEAISKLLHFSLVKQSGSDLRCFYSMHPKVHYWTTCRLDTEQRLTYLKAAIGVMCTEFPEPDYDNKEVCTAIYSHVMLIIEISDQVGLVDGSHAILIRKVAGFLGQGGITNRSLYLVDKALD